MDQLDESAFLKQEGAEAKAAISHTIEELKASLHTAADLSLWTRQHPWAAVGVAAAAGFAVANAVTPSKHPPAPPWVNYSAPGYAPSAAAAPPGASPLNSLLAPLFDMAKVALQSTIASAIGGVMTKEAVEANTPPQPHDVASDTYTSETSAAL